ncbi:MAG: YggS family pyridoxal phosphate-dependent enzyme [Saprospiraceae bacterium]|nr:YggS family pyridoxal phosphate-dependent enzyme [Saprospiraceae bacterium]
MLKQILEELKPTQTQLVAVSKTKPNEAILNLYDQGQRAFGENYVQELVEKQATLPNDILWHFIGHLQSNKVKYIAPFVTMIHSVDSFKLLQEINKQAAKHNRVIKVLLQFHIAEEESKFGFDTEGVQQVVQELAQAHLNHVEICGVMGMATFTDDKTQVRREFQHLKSIFDNLKYNYFAQNPSFTQISMGMSDDYKMAIEEGSTMVRIGSLLFGKRY